jgi:hypothetical protein
MGGIAIRNDFRPAEQQRAATGGRKWFDTRFCYCGCQFRRWRREAYHDALLIVESPYT